MVLIYWSVRSFSKRGGDRVKGVDFYFSRHYYIESLKMSKQEIKDEIIELFGATQALGDAMNLLHAQRMEKSKQMMALNQMLKDMDGDDAEEKNT